jgi:hypothetical protein
MDRRRAQPERPKRGRVVRARSDWHARLPDRCPAYLSWEQDARNLARLAANQARASTLGAVRHGAVRHGAVRHGAVRHGAALLAGWVVCARCGVRLGVQYQQSHGRPIPFTYDCAHRRPHDGEALCQQVAGPRLDAVVIQPVLAALEPAALA